MGDIYDSCEQHAIHWSKGLYAGCPLCGRRENLEKEYREQVRQGWERIQKQTQQSKGYKLRAPDGLASALYDERCQADDIRAQLEREIERLRWAMEATLNRPTRTESLLRLALAGESLAALKKAY